MSTEEKEDLTRNLSNTLPLSIEKPNTLEQVAMSAELAPTPLTTKINIQPQGRIFCFPRQPIRNKYCSDCLYTHRFLDLGRYIIGEECHKRLERVGETAPQNNYEGLIE
ncbi:MAG: hypothetical protein Q7R96_04435 [Nanoarchaeota archaeon]|nr:hypothetical protein [Nanoarchaeota archaeon]